MDPNAPVAVWTEEKTGQVFVAGQLAVDFMAEAEAAAFVEGLYALKVIEFVSRVIFTHIMEEWS